MQMFFNSSFSIGKFCRQLFPKLTLSPIKFPSICTHLVWKYSNSFSADSIPRYFESYFSQSLYRRNFSPRTFLRFSRRNQKDRSAPSHFHLIPDPIFPRPTEQLRLCYRLSWLRRQTTKPLKWKISRIDDEEDDNQIVSLTPLRTSFSKYSTRSFRNDLFPFSFSFRHHQLLNRFYSLAK